MDKTPADPLGTKPPSAADPNIEELLDTIPLMLDDLADILAAWKKRRDEGLVSSTLYRAALAAVTEISDFNSYLAAHEKDDTYNRNMERFMRE